MEDRLHEVQNILEKRLNPETKKFFKLLMRVYEDINYLDVNDWEEWLYDESKLGLEAYLKDMFKDYLKGRKK